MCAELSLIEMNLLEKKLEKKSIITTSWLGIRNRAIRLENHISQLKELSRNFDSGSILNICSEYDKAEQKAVDRWDCVFVKERTKKFKVHNVILRYLYSLSKSRALLLLDDDVVPVVLDDINIDPYKVLCSMLSNPLLIPGPCVFFSSRGLVFDVYYRSRTKDFVQAPKSVVGWAILVRNDLGVLQADDTPQEVDDYAFRVRCASYGKLVLKHQRLFFRTLQKKEVHSTLVENHEERKRRRLDLIEMVNSKYPHLFRPNGQFIWTGGHRQLELRRLAGLLTKTDYGYIPVSGIAPRSCNSKVTFGFGGGT